jgi:aminoglycoside phosphotransferase (APT) family kinase protein
MIDPDTSSSVSLAQLLARWLEVRIPGAAALRIDNVAEPTQGQSSETVLFDAIWRENGQWRERGLVARIQRRTICPMLADVMFQHDVMKAIAAHSDTAVPVIAFSEPGGDVIGQPFFLMERIDGRVPSDFPLFHSEGWVADLAVAERTRLWWNAVSEMTRLHRIDPAHAAFIGDAEVEPGSRFYLRSFIGSWLEWAAQGRSFPAIAAAMEYLLENVPQGEATGLVWNDARMGNTMFADDLGVAALLDFEVASLGPPEIDLAWWLYCEDLFSVQFGIERLAGIPSAEDAIAGFEKLYGRAMPEFDYYLAIAALKHAVLSVRDYSNGKTIDTPEALPGFALDRLAGSIDRHKQAAALRRRP